MAKKKRGKKSKNDARGYGQKSQPVVPATANKVAPPSKAPPSSVVDKPPAEVSSKVSKEAETTKSEEVMAMEAPSKRFFRKIENLHDQLIECGFSEEHVESVVKALATKPYEHNGVHPDNIFAIEEALDWLCLNLSAEQLPSLFVEAEIKNKASETTTKLEVLESTGSHQTSDERAFDSSTNIPVAVASSTEAKDEEVVEDDHQKAWILNQYQYEEDVGGEEEEDNEPFPTGNEKCEIQQSDEVISPEEVRLAGLEKQLEELRFAVNDDVANYMRSKDEIKGMKKELSKLNGTVKKLRAKVEKIRTRRAAEASEQDGLEQEDEVGGMLDIFQQDGESPSKGDEQLTELAPELENKQASVISRFEPAIPKDWTGTTPKSALDEYCRKKKFPRPTYQKPEGIRRSVRLLVKATPSPVVVEYDGGYYEFVDVQNLLATEALYKLNPDLPMYRLFPTIFRNLWKSWIDDLQNVAAKQRSEDRKSREKRIEELIALIPMHRRLGAEDKQPLPIEDDKGVEPIATSWEENLQKESQNSNETTLTEVGKRLQREFEERRGTSSYVSMLKIRESLPMNSYQKVLLETVEENRVTVLCAETGAGKTTQCPQFLLEDALLSGKGDKVSIICTQPRRISAMSVADRVADEMCDKLGGLVGYQIRMESKKSKSTKLMFCTTGVLLRRLQEDRNLEGVTHVVVDEVHERQWQIDFLLIVLRRLVASTRPDLKVILMSATLDAKLFCSFFEGAPFLSVPGRTFPVSEYYLEDLLDATDHVIEEDSRYALRNVGPNQSMERITINRKIGAKHGQNFATESQVDVSEVSGNYPRYKMATQRSMDRVDETVINYDLIEDVLMKLIDPVVNPFTPDEDSNLAMEGSVLIFLPGMGEIRSLSNRLMGSRHFGNNHRFKILALHSSLSPQDQKKVFLPSPKGCRKIILSTNIAETSVTIPDVVCVIDTGLVREVRQDKRFATSKLVLGWCSKASTKQRAGRAGRVRSGVCCKLYSSLTAEKLRQQTMPELQRVALEEVCLSVLASKLTKNCMDFLQQAPEPPSEESVRVALRLLTEVGALVSTGQHESLTPLGGYLAKLPVHPRLGKMLVFGAIFKCLDPILTVVASLSSKSPFVNAMDNAIEATARRKGFEHDSSDFLTFVNVWQAFEHNRDHSTDRGRKFCRRNFLNWTTLMEIGDVRKQLLELVSEIGFVDKQLKESEVETSAYNEFAPNDNVVNTVISAGLHPNIAHVVKEGLLDPPAVWHRQEQLYFHKSSVNHNKHRLPSDWIVFHEKFATSRTTVSATSVVSPVALILFGGDVVVKHLERTVVVNDWITFPMAAQTAVMLREQRKQLDQYLQARLQEAVNKTEGATLDTVINLL